MDEGDGLSEEVAHRLRSTLLRLRFELDLSESLSVPDRDRLVTTVRELAELLGVRRPDASLSELSATVVIVEDDEDLATLLVQQLKRRGINATWVPTIQDAMEASSSAYLVVDLSATDSAVERELEWLRRREPIVFTGASQSRAAKRAIEISARTILLKPVDADALASALSQLEGEARE